MAPSKKELRAGILTNAGQYKFHHADILGIAAAGWLKPGGDAGALISGALRKRAVGGRRGISSTARDECNATRSPTAKPFTAAPTRTIVPAVSWPKTRGGGTVP